MTEANPFRATQEVSGRALTRLQLSYVIETAKELAEENPVHERSLFMAKISVRDEYAQRYLTR
ncbi:hypothetical protein [Pseudomonas migulae]|uniref:hypothetical protein n=1 Tax=Pseudomonas migulae TaxID=78543 RepID=UPI003CC7ACF0